jgi:hypothetical protein
VAEKLVLFDLSIDASGVASGVRQTSLSLGRLERDMRATGSTADAVAKKLFSLPAALMKLAGPFGVAGVTFAAANGVANLTKELVTSTQWFQTAAAAAADFWGKVKGEGVMGSVTRHLDGFGALGVLKELKELQGQRTKALTDRAGMSASTTSAVGGPVPMGAFGAMGMMQGSRIGSTGVTKQNKEMADAIQATSAAVVAMDRKSNALIQTLRDLDVSMETITRTTGAVQKSLPPTAEEMRANLTSFFTEHEKALKEAAAEAAKVQKVLDDIQIIGENPLPGMELAHVQLMKGTEELSKWNQFMIDIRMSTIAASAAFGAFGEAVQAPTMKDGFKKMTEGVTMVNMAIDTAGAAVSSFASGLSAALISGSFGGRKFFGDMLASMVPVLLSYGALGLVRGFTGDATGFAAAKIAFPAALAAAAAARALGAGSTAGQSHGSGGGFGGASLAASGGSSAGPNVTVIVNGSLMGTNRAELAREIADMVEQARSDGAP